VLDKSTTTSSRRRDARVLESPGRSLCPRRGPALTPSLRGPHVDKKSREQLRCGRTSASFDILEPTPQTLICVDELDISAGGRRRNQELSGSKRGRQSTVYNSSGRRWGELTRSDECSLGVRSTSVHEVGAHRSHPAAPDSCRKERAAVSGSKKKSYRQKGHRRARHGAFRLPSTVGGARAHPPKPQDWS